MKKRFLNGIIMIEAENSRLNTSCPEVERTNGNENVTYTKKVGSNGMCSSASIKSNMKKFMIEEGFNVSQYIKDSNKIVSECDPIKFINEDVFGMMGARKVTISKEEYDSLKKEEQEGFKKEKKEYTKNITKKRDAKFKLNALIGLGTSRVRKEWGVCNCEGNYSMPYQLETYADLMSSIFNFDINSVGRFIISHDATELRDYSTEEKNSREDIVEELSREERLNRIKVTLKALKYLSIESNQSNYLTDTKPKAIILGEYSWGNNMFQGLITKNGVNIDGLKEVLDEYDDYRLSKIWIGLSNTIKSESFNNNIKEIKEKLIDYDVKVTSVGKVFDEYLEYIEKTLE